MQRASAGPMQHTGPERRAPRPPSHTASRAAPAAARPPGAINALTINTLSRGFRVRQLDSKYFIILQEKTASPIHYVKYSLIWPGALSEENLLPFVVGPIINYFQ